MTDREKVIKALSELHGSKETMEIIAEAIALLKEQEPKRAEWSAGRAHCPSCGELFPKKKDMTLYTRFCSFCGQKVKWE